MWLFTRLGFYSATVSKIDPSKIQIRARSRQDLLRLADFARQKAGLELGEPLEIPHADYRYRLHCSRADWAKLAALLAEDIDYTNFKDQIKDDYRHHLYMKVWSIMYGLQHRSEAAE